MTVHDHENFERQNSLEEGIGIPIALQFFKFHGQTLPQHLDIASQSVLIDPSQTLNSENSRLSRKRGGGEDQSKYKSRKRNRSPDMAPLVELQNPHRMQGFLQSLIGTNSVFGRPGRLDNLQSNEKDLEGINVSML